MSITRLHLTKTSAGECWVSAVSGVSVAEVFEHGDVCTVLPLRGGPVCGLTRSQAAAMCLRLAEVAS